MRKDKEGMGMTAGALGPRLAELRRRAGLTQRELSARMDCSAGGRGNEAGRYERGEVANPGVWTLAAYLRACRAGFVDVLDVLDRYTRQAPVPEARAARAIAELESRLVGVARIRPGADFTTKTQRHKVVRSGMETAKDAKNAKGGKE